MLAQALNMICGALMLIYGHIRAQKQIYVPATLTPTGKAISGEYRLRAVTAVNSIMRAKQCEKVVLVHFSYIFGFILLDLKNASRHSQKHT